MRSVLLCLAFLAAATPVAVAAEPVAPAPATDSAASELDRLLGELKRTRQDKAAERIAARVWERWRQSGSASIDLLMQWSDTAIRDQNYAAALDFLDRVTLLEPDFAEGWNRRATVHFLMNNHVRAMRDIDQTLRLEPRHFGALTGMAQILKATGRDRQALEAYARALAIYPMLRSAQAEYATLAEELADRGT